MNKLYILHINNFYAIIIIIIIIIIIGLYVNEQIAH